MSHCLLIVEKDIAVRHPLAEYLRQCGYKVVEVITTDEALTLLHSDKVRPDVLLADVRAIGTLDGFELARTVRTMRPDVEVLLAGSIEKIVHEASELCEDGPSMRKPYRHDQVLEEIRRRLAARERLKQLD